METRKQAGKAQALREMPSRLLSQAAALLGGASNEVFRAHEMHRYQFAVLATLDEFGPVSQAELCRRTDIDRSDMTGAVNALEDGGDVSKEVDPTSRRQNVVALTATGKARFKKVLRAQREAQGRVLGVLSNQDRDELVRLLQSFVDGGSLMRARD